MGLSTFLTLIGGYMVSSAILMRFPTLIHKKKTVKFLAKHISHRGGKVVQIILQIGFMEWKYFLGSAEGYENTLSAFKKAIDLGTQMIELDVHLTKDRKVVAVHDNNLQRLTGIDLLVSNTPYDKLPLLQSIIPIDFLPGTFYESENSENEDRRIPLLEDVFRTFRDLPINVDVKVDDDVLIQEVSRLITAYNREDLCVWGNTWYKINEKCYHENPNIYRFCSRRRALLLLLYHYTGLLPFVPIKETHLEIFLPSIYEKFSCYSKYSGLTKFIVRIVEFLFINESFFRHLKKRGMHIYIWVLNEEKYFEVACKAGANGIMTDKPTKLKEFYDQNPHYFNCQE